MEKRIIDISIKARYFIRGKDNSIPKHTWLCLHGYGQLAEYFIKHFDVLSDHHKIIAPEGLHRFYLKDNSGRVGASWMTKLDREQDIQQYCNYLESVLDVESQRTEPIIAFGFSQGTATIGRWLCQTKRPIKAMVLWAGAWPHDMVIDHNKDLLRNIPIYIVVGDKDQYLGGQGIDKYLAVFNENDIEYTLLSFQGDHRLDKDTLLRLANELGSE